MPFYTPCLGMQEEDESFLSFLLSLLPLLLPHFPFELGDFLTIDFPGLLGGTER